VSSLADTVARHGGNWLESRMCRLGGQFAGIVRIDYILKADEFYFLEVNTTPGMTATSFVPQQIAAMGMTLKDMITLIIGHKISH